MGKLPNRSSEADGGNTPPPRLLQNAMVDLSHAPAHALRCAAFGVALFVVACGPTKSTAAGTIAGTVYYDGSAAGGGRPLGIAVYKTYPPSGPPVTYQLVDKYQFPYHYVIDGLSPGTYYVGALIDVDPADTRYVGMLNPKRDPHGYAGSGQQVRVEEFHGTSGVDVVLEEHR